MTRDRRGFENTFLLHADRQGDRPRLLYWYRTAPGIVLGRPPLDEDAIRAIEDSHPDIEFDWPAILALSEVMTPEEEAPVRPQKKKKPAPPPQEPRSREQRPRESRRDAPGSETPMDAPAEELEDAHPAEAIDAATAAVPSDTAGQFDAPPANRLLDELVGREIATRLRGRYAEIVARIAEQDADGSQRDAWIIRAEPLNADAWMTPEAILNGVRAADELYETLRAELGG